MPNLILAKELWYISLVDFVDLIRYEFMNFFLVARASGRNYLDQFFSRVMMYKHMYSILFRPCKYLPEWNKKDEIYYDKSDHYLCDNMHKTDQ